MELIPKHFIEPLLAVAVGISLSIPMLLLNVRIAPKLGLFDWPKARGLAEDQIPIVGYALVLLTLGFFGVALQAYDLSPWFVTTAVIMAVMGHFDDRRPLPALDKMFFQIICVVTVVLFDPKIHEAMTVRYGSWGTFWAIFFILGLINAINFIDGIDGLAGIVLLSGAAGFILFGYDKPALYGYVLYCALLIGSLAPFLYLNIVRRRGFLGNVGSYFFSYVLAMIHLSMPAESSDSVSRLSLSGLCFLVPIADACMVLVSRLLTRRSPFQADKGHLHHRLVQTGLPLRYTLGTFGTIQILGVIAAFTLNEAAGTAVTGLPVILCVCFITIVTLLIKLVETCSKRRVQTFFQHIDKGDSLFFFKYTVRQENGETVPPHILSRLEARINAEIRVSDLCYLEKPDTIFVALKAVHETLRAISNRLDVVFQAEKVKATLSVEQGEFIKVPHMQRDGAIVKRMYS